MIKLLETINDPADLRQLPRAQLKAVADELRACVLDNVARTGGHLSSNLGTVELTVALHYVFDFGHDRLLFDVGHQCYPHKLLTGRLPKVTDTVQWEDWKLEVVDMDGKTIDKVLATRMETTDEAPADSAAEPAA